MLNELKKIADWLDRKGYQKEADRIDSVLVSLADFEEQPSNLFESGVHESEETNEASDGKYSDYFEEKMNEFDIENIKDLSDSEKKKFFNDVDSGWQAKGE